MRSRFWVGFDVVGKAFHWVCVLDEEGERLLSRRMDATETDIEAALSEIEKLCVPGERMVGLDLLTGGPATLLEALLLDRGEGVFRVSGIALNRAREAYVGGERKSDPVDAQVIADQLSGSGGGNFPRCAPRTSVLASCGSSSLTGETWPKITSAASRSAQGAPLGCVPHFGGDVGPQEAQGPLLAVSKVAPPAAARRLGEARLSRWLKAKGVRKAGDLARGIITAAKAQRRELPAALKRRPL
jgi:hypothetical protein